MAADRKPGFNEVCEACGRDLHSCRHCRFYKPGIHWDCAESAIQDSVADKERRNFCDWFETNPVYQARTAGAGRENEASQRARSDLDKLFGG